MKKNTHFSSKNHEKLAKQHLFAIDDLTFRIIRILDSGKNLDDSLSEVCEAISSACTSGNCVSVCINFDGKSYKNQYFSDASVEIKHKFELPEKQVGTVELFFSRENREHHSGNLLEDAERMLKTVVPLLVGLISKIQLEKLAFDIGERRKELEGINRTTEILKKSNTIEELFQQICSFLSEAMQFPAQAATRIRYGNQQFTSQNFRETPWRLAQIFDTSNAVSGSIEVFYLEEFPEAGEGPFLLEERHLIDNLAELIAGTVSRKALGELLIKNTERLKELRGINRTGEILQSSQSLEEALPRICALLPESWQYPEFTAARINYDKNVFESANFTETEWKMEQEFEAPGTKKGTIEIFYLKQFPTEDEGPFLKEERNLLVNLSTLIAGSATRDVFSKLYRENTERLKELRAINQTTQIIDEGKTVDETLTEICALLPRSWQYPKYTASRIEFEGKTYSTPNFQETEWVQTEHFVTIDNKKGTIEIVYLKAFPREDEGPFLQEERNLLINIARLISGYLNNYKGREIIHRKGIPEQAIQPSDNFRNSLVSNKKPLQLYFNQQSIDKYVYLDMMKYKIKHILFVATLYDAFTLENEDSFFERFMGSTYQYSLFSVPRITGVTSAEEALALLETTNFDLVILMAGMDRDAPVLLSEQIRAKNEALPIYLLLNRKSDIKYFEELVPTIRSVDKLFVWNGDSLILFAIVKSLEDKVNVENDTKIGLVRVILLIEDSPLYYSKYLQFLYDIVFSQVQELLPEVEKNELDKISKMRSRPKILLARNYEEAIAIFNKYKDFMLCVISDMEFDHGGKLDKHAGVNFIKYVKSHISKIPIILQSSENRNRQLASDLEVAFINKNSETLLNDLRHFLVSYLGFGHFVFRDRDGNKIAVAKSLREFENLLLEVPDESLYLHASENQLSLWLMSRGEIQLAKSLNPVSANTFGSIKEMRQFFRDSFKQYREEKKKGKILSFDETSILDEKNIVSFSGGSLGGKGRGLAFINTLIYNIEFPTLVNRINILAPITVIIGSNEFQHFIAKNRLLEKIVDPDISYAELRKHFVEAHLSISLLKKLRVFVSQIDKPIAVRSSSSSEDSITQPFAGVFDTYIIPNHNTNKKLILERISTAIKLVFASTFSEKARNYFSIIHHKVEEEKMAVVLQELVGNQYDDYYYPHISGVAQSYNYYPVANMKPEEGFAVAAVGLGTYVVDGWKSFRFSPRYPKVSIHSTKDLLNNSQVQFYALDCSEKEIDFLEHGELAALKLLDISEAEKHGTLTHCASVYNPNNDRIEAGLSAYGPRIINFANILQYNYIPLAETISTLLNTVKEAFGSPVEIEYAVDLESKGNGLPTFYLLQIKPLIGNQITQNLDIERFEKSQMVLYTKSSLGNGEIKDIRDIIYVDPARFSKLKTMEMAAEIEKLNKEMKKSNRQYILIGPGRWGSRDRFVGIPVNWSQISNAKIIVEVSLENFPLDSSLGSHFFHNVTSMNIGYFSVLHSSPTDFVRWDLLNKQKVIHETEFYRHIRFENPLSILMDGRHKTSAIIF
ncbi:MAG TPA: PEP/pyruvate-binding domain-containing protein [Prolixibacteraceae bacterium]|nr:PEP/pyruvate-binding domain-containing protein [Prolixibacteraceae bacterium]HPR85088.1 PEP/pyruvate-binding domain-containing protein [Prolixibacteraceae bacterium]